MGPRRAALLLPLALLACGRSNPSATVGASRVRVVDGITREPVAGATVAFGATSVTSSADGSVEIEAAGELSVQADGYLQRDTYLRANDATLTLWPRRGELDASFTSTLVYADAQCPVDAPREAVSPMRRLPAGARVQVVVPAVLGPAAAAAHAEAAREIAAASGGAIDIASGTEASGAVNVVVTVDPSNATCRGDEPRAVTYLDESRGVVRGGRIVYCTAFAATRSELAAHELGHVAGLRHSAAPSDLMHCSIAAGVRTFQSRESAVLRLMYQRSAGTRFPDDDRGAISAASSGTTRSVISCTP